MEDGRRFIMMGSITSANLMCGMTGYNGLNYGGFYGGYGYGYGMCGGDVSIYQNNLNNNYDMWQTQNGYSNKPGVETMTINNQCQDIGVLLAQGRTDDASKEIEKMVSDLKEYAQYANYSDKEIRSVVRSLYQSATGSDLLADIDTYASGSFAQGIKEGCIFGGIAANKTTKADLIEQVTGVKKAKGDTTGEITGSVLSGAATYGAIGAGVGVALSFTSFGLSIPVCAAIGAGVGAVVGLVKAIIPSTHKVK